MYINRPVDTTFMTNMVFSIIINKIGKGDSAERVFNDIHGNWCFLFRYKYVVEAS